ncbi:beta-1,6-N-acetylglucosaminyltransferase [Yoonia sp. SS1-5]|uniref:Peptide O-xylosyltransferase n=1 Tax=Yoonia rhodophyticola TaxID=3137370 RepID=A0ABZ3JB91_9RHOB
MSKTGVIMLVHTALHRAEQAIRHWVKGGCPVIVHIDKKVSAVEHAGFVQSLSDLKEVQFSRRYNCDWGGWALVKATQDAATQLLDTRPDLRHVYLASGACLPMRPVTELCAYLDARPETDFIESSTTSDVPWTVGGLHEERFTLRFPFSWRRHRRIFDFYVKAQQLAGFRRRIPDGLVPHMGSQWWCLTRRTLMAILNDPRRPIYDRYFKRVWIPDESYFQTMARRHSTKIESRSLTLSKFDYQGKPHIFYDDHKELLRRAECFVARKIWPQADALYNTFPEPARTPETLPNPSAIDRVFANAVDRRTLGRPGLYMQSRFPTIDREAVMTAEPYSVLQGFAETFEDFEAWLGQATGADVHGHLFAPDRAHFCDGSAVYMGGLSDQPVLRDYNTKMFLSNLIWNARGTHQAFQFGPDDTQSINWMIAKDTNARISVISGAWIIPLFQSRGEFSDIRGEAARLQQIEHAHLKILRSPFAKARVRVVSLAEFVRSPMDILQTIVDEMSGQPHPPLAQIPRMVDLTGLGAFLQDLRNQGMHPFLTGEFPMSLDTEQSAERPPKPYLVQ